MKIRSMIFAMVALPLAVPVALAGPYDEAVLADKPIAYWRFEEPEGAVDSGNSGTEGQYNGITFEASAFENLGQAAVYAEPDLPGNPGSSNIDFGAFNTGALAQLANIDNPRAEFFDPDKKTSLEFWMKTSAEGNHDNNWRTQTIFGEESPGDGDIQWGYLRPGGHLGAVAVNDANHRHHESKEPINDGQWHYVVVTYDWTSGISQLYVDGEFDSEFQGGGNRNQDRDGGEIRYLGWNSRKDASQGVNAPDVLGQYVGSLDEVAIYDRILSAAGIDAHFAAAAEPAGDPALSLPRDTIFGLLPASPQIQDRVFPIRNSGETETLNITGVEVTGPDRDHFTVLSSPTTLGPGASGNLEVRFDSKGESGGFLASVEFSSNAENQPVKARVLSARINPASGLTSYYRLDETEGETALDSGGLARHGTYVGDVRLGEEGIAGGSAVATDGGHVAVPGRDIQEFGEAYTVSLWVQPAADELGTLFSKGSGGVEFILASTNGALLWFVGGLEEGEHQRLVTDPVLSKGQTHHLVLVQSEGKAVIYVDGVEVNRGESPAAAATDDDFLIGALDNVGNIGIRFPGIIDDVQIFEKALSADDVAAIKPGELYAGAPEALPDSDSDGLVDSREASLGTDPLVADTDGDGLSDGVEVDETNSDPLKVDTDGDGFSDPSEVANGFDPRDADSRPRSYEEVVLADGAVGYWRFEEGSGAKTAEDSAGDTDGTYNGITLGQPGPTEALGTAAEWSEPVEPGSSNIDFGDFGVGALGQLSNIDVPEGHPGFDLNKQTSVEFWMKTSQISGDANSWRSPVVFGEESPGDGDLQWGWVTNNGEIGFAINDGGGGVFRGPLVNDDTWHHIVQTFDFSSGELFIYLDGEEALSTMAANNRFQDEDGGLIRYMGWNSREDGAAGENSPHLLGQFVGLLDEVAIYSRVLSAEQVKQHFGLAFGPAGPAGVDSDGDGASDEAEGIAGTDPGDAEDYFRVTEIISGENGVELVWTAVPGKEYEAQFSTNLVAWETIGSALMTADAETRVASFIDPDLDRTSRAGAYYRVVVR